MDLCQIIRVVSLSLNIYIYLFKQKFSTVWRLRMTGAATAGRRRSALCLTKNLIYQATVVETAQAKQETYIGLASTSFKDRFANHKQSFKNTTTKKAGVVPPASVWCPSKSRKHLNLFLFRQPEM